MTKPTTKSAWDIRTVEIIKREVVGTVNIGENGSVDLLDHLATVAMNDARDRMNPDGPTKSTYEVDDGDLGITSVTIEHTPTSASAPLTVDEAKKALAEARRRERDGDTAVAEEAYS